MSETGFAVDTTLPFAWRAGTLTPTMAHGSLLLLRVVNLLDAHEAEADPGHERIEARLDLMLHWLGMQLFGDCLAPAPTRLRLMTERIEWSESVGDTSEVIVNLHVHPAMAAPLQLAGKVITGAEGGTTVDLQFTHPDLADAWTRWLFRLHRRAVQEARMHAEQD
jgi:hypothetical protein